MNRPERAKRLRLDYLEGRGLNDSIKFLLSYIRKFLRKKKVRKNKFYNEQKQVKNQVGKSNSQMLLSISFVCVICFTKRFRK
jgi:hypothetical protein